MFYMTNHDSSFLKSTMTKNGETRLKSLQQMLNELERSCMYMQIIYNPKHSH